MGAQLSTPTMNWASILPALRERLLPQEQPLTLTQLALLGAVVGALAGLAISGLHWLIDAARLLLAAAQGRVEGEWGDGWRIFLTTAGGGLLLGLCYQAVKPRHRHGGFVHIIERLTYHQGAFPSRNAWLQMLGTALATATHQAVGREGAAAHMGAYAGSWMGTRLGVPTASLRTLVGCGAAAGISASFNTPLAGVIFIMEVIVAEYTVVGLAPGIIAAVSANAVAHLWLQSHPALIANASTLASLGELPYLVLMGILLGLVARWYLDVAAEATARMRSWPVWLSMTAVGLLTALGAVSVTELVDNGFGVINAALAAELSLSTAASLAGLMLLCSALAIAAGLPGGVIMPCMLSGACLGLVLGVVGAELSGGPVSDPGVYALLGLGAMVAAVLQAPLTALVMVVELSSRTQILMPAMLVVVTAVLAARSGRSTASVFALVLRNRGLDYRNDPVSQSLRRISVMAAMSRRFVRAEPRLGLAQARALLAEHPDWIIVAPEGAPRFALAAADLLRACNALEQPGETEREGTEDEAREEPTVDLVKIPGERRRLASVHLRASLQEAWDTLREQEVEALVVERPTHKSQITVYGVLTREAVDGAYRT